MLLALRLEEPAQLGRDSRVLLVELREARCAFRLEERLEREEELLESLELVAVQGQFS
jgi:hypothetical protein